MKTQVVLSLREYMELKSRADEERLLDGMTIQQHRDRSVENAAYSGKWKEFCEGFDEQDGTNIALGEAVRKMEWWKCSEGHVTCNQICVCPAMSYRIKDEDLLFELVSSVVDRKKFDG